MRFHEEYRFFCAEKGLMQRDELLQLDDPPAIVLNGNCKARFNERLSDMEAAVVARALLTCKTTVTELIDFSYNNVGDYGAEKIAEFVRLSPSMLTINLSFNNIGAKGCRALMDALMINSSTKSINLQGNDLGEEGGAAVAQMLNANNTLTSLNIASCGLKTNSLIAIAGAMRNQISISELNLDKPLIPGLQESLSILTHFSSMLTVNESLRELTLSRWQMNDEQMEFLAIALCQNKTITSLNLSSNKLSSVSGKLLANVLRSCPQIVLLDVNSNRICDDGVIAIAEAAKTHPNLHSLNFIRNTIGTRGVSSVASMLEANPVMMHLKLWWNDWITEPAAAKRLYEVKSRIEKLESIDFTFQVVDGAPQVVLFP